MTRQQTDGFSQNMVDKTWTKTGTYQTIADAANNIPE